MHIQPAAIDRHASANLIAERIADELLPAESPMEQAENFTATGFLMVGDVETVEHDKAKMAADQIDTQLAKIGTALLGIHDGEEPAARE